MDQPADIYCLGGLMYELLWGHPPFFDEDKTDNIAEDIKGGYLSFPEHIWEDSKNLMESLLNPATYMRPKIS